MAFGVVTVVTFVVSCGKELCQRISFLTFMSLFFCIFEL